MSSTATPESLIEGFPNSELPKIQGQPTYEHLKELRTLLGENAASIQTTRGGGNHGYLGLILSDARYDTQAPGTPFVAPRTLATSTRHRLGHSRPNLRRATPVHRTFATMEGIQQRRASPKEATHERDRTRLSPSPQGPLRRFQQPNNTCAPDLSH